MTTTINPFITFIEFNIKISDSVQQQTLNKMIYLYDIYDIRDILIICYIINIK